MSRETILVERRGEGISSSMSPEGIKELWIDLLEANPEIKGVVMEIDDDHELPSMYEEIELVDAFQAAD